MKISSGIFVVSYLFLIILILCSGCVAPNSSQGSLSSLSPIAQGTISPATGMTNAAPGSYSSGIACRQGLSSCNGGCSDLTVDIGNCGACGVACPSGQSCSSGKCTCQNGLSTCNALCKDLKSDTANCGACGITCTPGQACNNGQCTVSCINSLTYCSGYCRDLKSDTANCGACGITCPSGQTCQNGQCNSVCGSGLTQCTGYCTNLYLDPANCGSCGTTCASGTCSNGQCTAVQQSGSQIQGVQLLQVQQIQVSWTGTWQTTYGPMTLTQNGKAVTGSYKYGSTTGTLSGTTSGSAGKTLSGSWIESSSVQGKFEFIMTSDHKQFTGWYSSGSSTTHSTWDGTKQ
jgi:hypothetical protein